MVFCLLPFWSGSGKSRSYQATTLSFQNSVCCCSLPCDICSSTLPGQCAFCSYSCPRNQPSLIPTSSVSNAKFHSPSSIIGVLCRNTALGNGLIKCVSSNASSLLLVRLRLVCKTSSINEMNSE